jgi:hypothetical protein
MRNCAIVAAVSPDLLTTLKAVRVRSSVEQRPKLHGSTLSATTTRGVPWPDALAGMRAAAEPPSRRRRGPPACPISVADLAREGGDAPERLGLLQTRSKTRHWRGGAPRAATARTVSAARSRRHLRSARASHNPADPSVLASASRSVEPDGHPLPPPPAVGNPGIALPNTDPLAQSGEAARTPQQFGGRPVCPCDLRYHRRRCPRCSPCPALRRRLAAHRAP